MPLTFTHHNYINACINHFFDFDEKQSEKQFKDTVDDIKAAFKKTLEKGHRYFELQQCIHSPERYLRNVEKQGQEPITIGEVQSYLFSYIKKQLELKITKDQKQQEEAMQDVVPFQFNENELLEPLLKTEKATRVFRSVPLPVAVEAHNPLILGEWENPTIFDITLDERDLAFRLLYVRVRLYPHASHESKIIKETKHNIPIFNTDLEEDQYKEKKRNEGKAIAFTLAINYLLTQLSQEEKIHQNALSHLRFSPWLANVLLHRYYFDLLLKHQFPLALFLQLTERSATILTDASIISLLKRHALSLQNAIHLTDAEKKVLSIPFYATSLADKTIIFETDIKGVSDTQAHYLSNPNIIELIRTNRVSIKNVLDMSPTAYDLICNPFYFQAIKEGRIDFRKIQMLSKQHKKPLLHPSVITLIAEGILSFDAALWIIDDKINEPKKMQEQEEKSIPLTPFGKAYLANNLPRLMPLIKAGLLLLSDIQMMYMEANQHKDLVSPYPRLPYLLLINIETRIRSLLDNTPFLLQGERRDSFAILKATCLEHRISFKNAFDTVLNFAVIQYYEHDNEWTFNQCLAHAKELNLPLIELYARLIGCRLLALHNQQPFIMDDTTDNIESIEEDAGLLAYQTHLSETKLMELAIQYCLISIKNDFTQPLKNETYKRIYEVIQETERTQSEAKSENPWLDTLVNVTRAAQNNIIVSPESYIGRPVKKQKLHTSIFKPILEEGNPLEVRDFCRRILIFQPLIPRNYHLHAAPASI